jgi:hypothetical protein
MEVIPSNLKTPIERRRDLTQPAGKSCRRTASDSHGKQQGLRIAASHGPVQRGVVEGGLDRRRGEVADQRVDREVR